MYANSISCYHPMHVPFHTHVTHTFKTWNQMELQKNIATGKDECRKLHLCKICKTNIVYKSMSVVWFESGPPVQVMLVHKYIKHTLEHCLFSNIKICTNLNNIFKQHELHSFIKQVILLIKNTYLLLFHKTICLHVTNTLLKISARLS